MSKKVFIDAGHGGNDSGAIGNGLYEKNINLPIAQMVRDILTNHGVVVKMSREGDTNPSLSQRTTEANKWGANAFISIHCDSYGTTAYGMTTFCYKFKYSSLADKVHASCVADKSLYRMNRGVKEADFHVLRETNMSACLIETAFISNSEDAVILKTKQKEFATAISKGILNYLGVAWKGNAPAPTPVPTNKPDVYYKVYANGKWLPEVKNLTDYAGIFGHPIKGVMVRLSSGDVNYKVSIKGTPNYYPVVKNYTDYAGDLRRDVDKVQIINSNVKYRVRLLNGSWLPWVIGTSDYAGIEEKSIDAIEVTTI